MFNSKRLRRRLKPLVLEYLRCAAKFTAFIFWASLYLMVMRMTIFKSSPSTPVVKDWSLVPDSDNYTKWLLQGPVLGEEQPEISNNAEWQEPDNETIYELKNRAAKVNNVCRVRALRSDTINNKEFFVDHKHDLVWCNIFKAASSFWLYKFNILGGYDNKFLSRTRYTPLILARKKFPRPSPEELRDAINTPGVISLIVVREPFVRLLSAYRDKLENLTPPYYRKLAKKIVDKYRENAIKIFGTIKNQGPTFYEFVSYLIETNNADDKFKMDEHWTPYYKFCTPCAVNFSVIAKVETLTRDSSFVVQQLGLGHVLGHKVKDRRTRIRTVMNKSKDGRNTTALVKYYFSQLDKPMLNDLLTLYGIDFEMFDYDPKVYYSYVRK